MNIRKMAEMNRPNEPQELDLDFDRMRNDVFSKFFEAIKPFVKELARIDDFEEMLRSHTKLIAKRATASSNGNGSGHGRGGYREGAGRKRKVPSARVDREATAPHVLDYIAKHPGGVTTHQIVSWLESVSLISKDMTKTGSHGVVMVIAQKHLKGKIRAERKKGKGEGYTFYPIRNETGSADVHSKAAAAADAVVKKQADRQRERRKPGHS